MRVYACSKEYAYNTLHAYIHTWWTWLSTSHITYLHSVHAYIHTCMHTYCSLITINPLNVCVSFVSVERISSEHSARETGGRRAQVMSAKHPNQSNLT